MEIERGRKKNQLIWSFILKVIAGQSLVKTLFLIKPEKGKSFEGNTLSQQRKRTQGFAPPLNQRERPCGSLTMGLEGPLVRFDWSPSPSFLSARTARGSGDHRRRTAAPRGHLRAGMGWPDRGGPLDGR